MAFQCGFFNSVDGDRVYNADDMTRPYHRIVSNGVFAQPNGSPSNDFQVISNNNMTVTVKQGEGIFFDKWSVLDADELINLDVAHETYGRIDSIVVRIDKSLNMRNGEVKYIKGTPASNPTPPALTRTGYIKEYRLANIQVDSKVGSIPQGKITDTRATDECGFVTHLLEQADITATYIQWQTQFDEWFEHLKETVSTATLITSFTSQYITTTQDETDIPIQIERYAIETDILQVFVNGLRLIPEQEYTILNYSTIRLEKPVDRNTPIAFIVYKSVNGEGITETVIQEINELYERVDATKVVSNNGSVKINVTSGNSVLSAFTGAGIGFHTMYSASGATDVPKDGAYRYFGQMTGSTTGYIFAMSTAGSVFSNYYYDGAWRGWRVLYEASPDMLWEGALYMVATANVIPSKTLSNCQHGWVLVWSDYDPDTSEKNTYNVVTCYVPKKNAVGNNWNGSSYMCMLPTRCLEDGTFEFTCKQIYIYNDHITGFAGNNQGNLNKNVVLSCIYEY